MKPHVHAELIKAWADGAEIEFRSNIDGRWYPNGNDRWFEDHEYRIKPQAPKPDVTVFFYSARVNREMADRGAFIEVMRCSENKANFVLTFDGETGELKSAEVLK